MRVLRERFKDLLLSVYLYNEWRGYKQLYEGLIPRLEQDPQTDPAFLAAVKKHAADERKHYRMFKGYFRSVGRMPFAVRRSIGYFDVLAHCLVGDLGAAAVSDERAFARLCRAVVTTELRGIRQVESLLEWTTVRDDARLRRIFQVIRRDEPSHFEPYQRWLESHGYRGPSVVEKTADVLIHYAIASLIFPVHYFNVSLPRLASFEA